MASIEVVLCNDHVILVSLSQVIMVFLVIVVLTSLEDVRTGGAHRAGTSPVASIVRHQRGILLLIQG